MTISNLSTEVEKHLRHYFATHGQHLPADGLYDRVLQIVEEPLIALSLEACRGTSCGRRNYWVLIAIRCAKKFVILV